MSARLIPSPYRMPIHLRALALATSLILPAVVAAQPAPIQHVRSTTLDNGLEVIVVPNSTIPMVTLQLVVRAGAITQASEEEEGIPHLIEHILFRSGDRFEERASRIEASWNGVTTSESVRYFLTFPSKHLETGVELVSDLVRKPQFSKDAIEAERKVVQGELERHATDPMSLLFTESEMLTWEGANWRPKNPGGNLFALNSATPDKLRALHARYYVPNNAALIVAGDVSDTAVFALANRVFRGWKRGTETTAPTVEIAPLTGIKRKVVGGEVKDYTILVRWHGPSVGTDRSSTYAAKTFAGLVNQPLSGTHKRLVDGRFADAVDLDYEVATHVGPVTLAVTGPAHRAAAAVQAVGRELAMLVQPDYFSDEDLALAKTWRRVGDHFRFESASGSSHLLGDYWSAAGRDYYVTFADSVAAQRREDVQRFVNQYIKGKPMSVVVMLPPSIMRDSLPRVQRAVAAWRAP